MTELGGGCKTVSFTHRSFYTQYFTMPITALYCKTFIVAVILSKRLLVKMQWYLIRGAANLDRHQQIQWHMEGAGLSSFAFLFSFDNDHNDLACDKCPCHVGSICWPNSTVKSHCLLSIALNCSYQVKVNPQYTSY